MNRNKLFTQGKLRAVVSQKEALALITKRTTPVVILEVVSDYYADEDARQYRRKHPIQGFFQINSDRFEQLPMWNLRSDETMIKVLEEYGITPASEKMILLYDTIQIDCGNATSRFDASARIYSVLKYFGFENVAIIMDNKITSHFPNEFALNHPEIVRRLSAPETSNTNSTPSGTTHLRHPIPVEWSKEQISRSPSHKNVFVSYETLLKMIAGELGPYRLLDARSAEEYAGTFTGYDFIPVAGRIPTSESIVNGDFQLPKYEILTDILERLERTFRRRGISKTDRIIWYCGTGWRAARMFALSHALGYKKVGIYEGGWNEWYQRHPL
ncbi:MAG: hypothetical protein DWQ07_03490 [Chloroflexi bacterium]|nr:MAG: hypothetical protein DWQ07_03490 [Chloroflexota bacterium]MBL1193435.1 hypothetical protein [Chloroflexota bacterium]NOH10726.1 hypothetical protein [Chloroflexota bacterium]